MSLVEHHGAIFRGIGVSDTGTAKSAALALCALFSGCSRIIEAVDFVTPPSSRLSCAAIACVRFRYRVLWPTSPRLQNYDNRGIRAAPWAATRAVTARAATRTA